MASTFSEDEIDLIYRKWARLGWAVHAKPFPGEIDPEDLIAETTKACRVDNDRLLSWLLTWIKDYSDVINRKKLIRLLPQADTAVLGAALDIAMANGADSHLSTITAQCRPIKKPELLFVNFQGIVSYVDQERTKCLPVYRKWGLICSQATFYDDTKRIRSWVLEHNKRLAIRALWGANIRAEIFYMLSQSTGLAIKSLAREIGYAYSAVHKEVEALVKSGFVDQVVDNGFRLSLSRKTQALLKAI